MCAPIHCKTWPVEVPFSFPVRFAFLSTTCTSARAPKWGTNGPWGKPTEKCGNKTHGETAKPIGKQSRNLCHSPPRAVGLSFFRNPWGLQLWDQSCLPHCSFPLMRIGSTRSSLVPTMPLKRGTVVNQGYLA